VLNADLNAMVDVKILKISHATLTRIEYFSPFFSPTQNIKIYCLIPLKNSLFHTSFIIKHNPTSGYRIGYGSDVVFTISVSAPNLWIRIQIRILTDVKKWYSYPGWRWIRMRISTDNPHPMAPLNGINSEGGTVSDAVTGTCWRKSGDLEEQKVRCRVSLECKSWV